MSNQDLSNLLTERYYPIAVKILNYLEIYEIVDCFHASDKFQNVAIDVLKRRKDDKGWDYINGGLNEDFLKEFHFQLKWKDICRQKLSESFIREYSHKVDWKEISRTQNLSEDFIIEFEDKVDWYYVSIQQKLSENFIRRFKHKLNWRKISSCQDLTEDFMKELKYLIDWQAVKKKYKWDLSIEFLLEFQFCMEDTYLNEKKGIKRKVDDNQ